MNDSSPENCFDALMPTLRRRRSRHFSFPGDLGSLRQAEVLRCNFDGMNIEVTN